MKGWLAALQPGRSSGKKLSHCLSLLSYAGSSGRSCKGRGARVAWLAGRSWGQHVSTNRLRAICAAVGRPARR